MSNSTNSRFGRWNDEDDGSNRPHKKQRYSSTKIEKKPIIRNFPQSNQWVATRYLGSGSYGSVYLAISNDNYDNNLDDEIVIKSSEISKAYRLRKEEKFLTRLNCPFVVSCYGHELDGFYYNLMLEYCPGQCLAKYVKSRQGEGLEEDVVKRLAIDILVGLKYIHGEKIIHCDIKPKNILLVDVNDEKIRFRAKISGFGKATVKGSIEIEGWDHKRSTTRFMSPELVRDMDLDYGADVWAFGCTVLEMLTGQRAWGEHGELDWEEWISLIGESSLVPHVPNSLSPEARDFLSKCLERDPSRRWSVDSLLKHQFLSWRHVYSDEEEEEEEEIADVAYIEEDDEAYLEDEEVYDEIEDVFEEEQEEIEIDEEYPKAEDSDEDP